MQVKTMGDLGALVRSARTDRGMTQADLAALLHTSRDWVIRLEKGHPRLEAQRVLDALRVVGIDLHAAVSGTPLKTPSKSQQQVSRDPFDALFGPKKA